MTRPRSSIVVGVAQGQADAVLLVAAEFAQRFAAELVCAVVDESHFTVVDRSGRAVVEPIDPDGLDDTEQTRARLERAVGAVLEGTGVEWSVRFLTGEPAAAIASTAADVDAPMIVIGTRPRTVAHSLREFVAGSIAAHLAHRQARPVIVVPLDPAPPDGGLPWEPSDGSTT